MKQICAAVGDYYHPEDFIKPSLEMALQPLTEAGLCRLKYISVEQLAAELPNKPDAIILFRENRVNPKDESIVHWLTEDMSSAIARYVEEGGGWLAWHSGLASYPVHSSYIGMLKGHFEFHPAQHQIVRYTGFLPDEPGGAVSYDILDEHYFVSCREEQTNVFLRSESVDGSSIGGWMHAYGKGRVCCLTPAHNKEGLLHPESVRLLRSCIRYVLGHE